jgi:signal transduction histidine kinase
MAAPTEQPELDTQIETELVRIVRGDRFKYVDGVPIALLIAVALSGAFPKLGAAHPVAAIVWVLTQSVWAIAGVVEWQRSRRLVPPEPARKQHLRLAILWASHGALWGSMVPVFWSGTNVTNESLVCIAALGVIVSSFAQLSPLRLVFLADVSALFAITEATFVWVGGPLVEILAILFPLFTAVVLRYGWQLSGRYEQAVRLQLQNEQLANSLGVARSRAEAASRAKSQFLANMSHELRTPLNAVLGFSEMIASRTMTRNIERHYEYAELINQSGRHLLNLIDDILDLAKIEAGSLTLHETAIDLEALFKETLVLLEPKARQGSCTLDYEITGHWGQVRADERAIKQIVLNLLSNSLKFTRPGGRVTAFAFGAKDGGVTIGVRDTGVGIAEEDQVRVFEDFGQGRHDIVTADKGTGLGLPIVRGLAAAHGGTVSLVSEVGKGTTVFVALPASRTIARHQLAS